MLASYPGPPSHPEGSGDPLNCLDCVRFLGVVRLLNRTKEETIAFLPVLVLTSWLLVSFILEVYTIKCYNRRGQDLRQALTDNRYEVMASFEGQVVVITGAGSGIGRATAIRMAKGGASLALLDISAATLSITLQDCIEVATSSKADHCTECLDVRSTEDVERCVQNVVSKYGSITHVFNCAGINPTKLEIEQTSDEYWHRLIDTNLKSVFTMTRACLPRMKSGSSLVNVSSVCGLNPTEGLGVYCATKSAVISFSKCMALETGPKGIRVNIICPGAIHTPTNNSVRLGPEKVGSVAETIALRRFGTPEEVADVVAFLFSNESRYMNGSVVEINGGMGRP